MTPEIDTLRAELKALKQRHEAGELPEADWHAARAPLERRLADLLVADDTPAAPAVTASPASATPATATQPEPAAPRPSAPRPSRALTGGVIAFVLVVAAGGYAITGEPRAIDPAARAAAPAEGGGVTREQIMAMVERLAERMKAQPDDVEGWTMLGRSYLVLEQPREAQAAFERARALKPQDPSVLADLADAIALNQGRVLAGEPARLVAAALAQDPDHRKALALAGSAAYEARDYATAARHWSRIVALEPADSPLAAQARSGVEEARQLAAAGPTGAGRDGAPGAATGAGRDGTSGAAPRAAAAASASVSGTVSLAAALKDQARPQDTVFVVARAAEGPRMPLAVLRAQVKDLPLTFTLDDRLAMAPGAGLSSATRVIVTARVSRSGQAAPQTGDLEGQSTVVSVGARDLRLEITRVVP
jgi:cytochrome c-type biogenesis protein CcmH